ncbi:LysR family transcriptional regulator [Phaeobacter sp. PT47_59]|uniref:LysR family transcriptional regulator n=1 Tax=Phaeobacter sp. PT47_59 TaxID=3029979 RepID=UPI002380A61E|nr:LysR family transcriptional regulator [Phaeobacter sp. PT47_59]MDE4176706.1 LysR family transcriptional regulator [Phaeobacter sp. PT47_59]
MPRPLDLDLLRTLAAVADTGSFSLAAGRVGRSQSAVSMQIRKLEAEIGQPLLLRGTRKVTATPAGRDLLAYAQRLLRISEEALAHLTRPEETGTVRLGVPEDYTDLLVPILERFGLDHPLVTVDLSCASTTELTRDMEEGHLDLAIVTRFAEFPATVLRREPMVWVASPRHAVWEKDPLPVALFQTCAARANILKALADTDRRFVATYSSASLAGMATIVRSGLAVAGMALCSVPPSVSIIGDREGLPPLRDLEVGLLCGTSQSGASERLKDAIEREIGAVKAMS